MDLKQIEKLMSAMTQSGIKRILLKKEDFEIEIERESSSDISFSHSVNRSYAPSSPSPPSLSPLESYQQDTVQSKPLPSEETEKKNLYVTSPMVGTFYISSSPDDPPFIKVGDTINEGTVVCIIEAMKVMNEVKAGIKGVVAEILIRNGEPVEFGTHIVRVTPS